jgi:hypothetical protein
MTGDAVIARAWDMVGDIDTSIEMKRYKLVDMVNYLNDGIHDLIARRPELLLSSVGVRSTFTDITTVTYATSLLPVSESYREPLAHYIASRIFEVDSDDASNKAMIENHRSQYLRNT